LEKRREEKKRAAKDEERRGLGEGRERQGQKIAQRLFPGDLAGSGADFLGAGFWWSDRSGAQSRQTPDSIRRP